MPRRVVGAVGAVVMLIGVGWYGVASASGDNDARSRFGSSAGWPAATAAASMAQAEQQAAGQRQGRTLAFVSEAVRGREIDINEDGFDAGDFFVFEERVFDSSGRDRVGRDSVRCELAVRTFGCLGTINIRGKGKIEIAGRLFAPRDNVIPVTGGTGAYEGVGGRLLVFDLRGGRTALVFHLTN